MYDITRKLHCNLSLAFSFYFSYVSTLSLLYERGREGPWSRLVVNRHEGGLYKFGSNSCNRMACLFLLFAFMTLFEFVCPVYLYWRSFP